MSFFIELSERRLIPNWRDFNRTAALGELKQTYNLQERDIDISKQLFDWSLEKNIGVAADLVGSAFLAHKTDVNEVQEAVQFVKFNKEESSLSLNSLVNKILKIEEDKQLSRNDNHILRENVNFSLFEQINSFIEVKGVHLSIHNIKRRLSREQKNSILWVELSRLYSLLGQEDSAKRAMTIALSLNKNNRFILRSSTRLFIHYNDYERALFYLRKSEAINKDPWLLSAHIASSSLAGRHQIFGKKAIELVDGNSYNNFDLTELTSSLGTLEFVNGNFKRAKKFFNTSIKSPNDNSLAQIEWISSEDSRFQVDPSVFEYVENPFEAVAQKEFELGNWSKVQLNCINWFLDMPYSRRPVALATYVSSLFLEDYTMGIALSKAGLNANPNDPILLNNLLFCLCLANRLEEARVCFDFISKIQINNLPSQTIITLQATLGLYFFRTGNSEKGVEFYNKAVENAERQSEKQTLLLVLANYLRELLFDDQIDVHLIAKKLLAIESDKLEKHFRELKNRALENYNKKYSNV